MFAGLRLFGFLSRFFLGPVYFSLGVFFLVLLYLGVGPGLKGDDFSIISSFFDLFLFWISILFLFITVQGLALVKGLIKSYFKTWKLKRIFGKQSFKVWKSFLARKIFFEVKSREKLTAIRVLFMTPYVLSGLIVGLILLISFSFPYKMELLFSSISMVFLAAVTSIIYFKFVLLEIFENLGTGKISREDLKNLPFLKYTD